MRGRWLLSLGAIALVTLTPPLAAQDAKQDTPPTIVVRVRSLMSALEGAKLFSDLIGQGEKFKEFDDLIKSKIGLKGLEAIDLRQPLGLYVRLAKELPDSAIVAVVPVANEKAFLEMLGQINFTPEKGQNDYYTIKQPEGFPSDVYLRFADKYAYFSIFSADHIDAKRLIPPAKLFPGVQKSMLNATIRIDQIPEEFRNQLLQGIEQGLTKDPDKKDGKDNAFEKALGSVLGKEIQRLARDILADGTECVIDLDIDQKKNELRAEIALSGKENSNLTRLIAQLGPGKSLFPNLLHKNAALNALINVKLPEKLHEALNGVIDEAVKKILTDTQDEKQKDLAKKLLDALTPSFKTGEFDVGLSLRGPSPNKLYTLVAGIKMKDVDKLTEALRELIKSLPPAEQALIEQLPEMVEGAPIFRFDLHKGKDFDERTKATFGANPLYVAFRKDAVIAALGEDGLNALKQAVAAEPATSAPVRFEMSVSRFALLMAKTDQEREAAQKLVDAKDDPRIVLTVEGGQQLRVLFRMDLSALRILGSASGKPGQY
jgi:hypothetical protein